MAIRPKIIKFTENLFTPYVLIALNLLIILSAEFVGGGEYFASTGLVHGIVILFLVLIFGRIFSDYAFSDPILRGFLNIQLSFFLYLGFVHLYEYLGLGILALDNKVVEVSVSISYLLWFLGMLLSLEFVSRIYYHKKGYVMGFLVTLISIVAATLVYLNISPSALTYLPTWFPEMSLVVVVALMVAEVSSVVRMRKIMPVFVEYSRFAIPAMVLLFFASFSEYSESSGLLETIGLSDTQNLYISHFLIYGVLSLLLIGFGRLKRPMGIYEEM